MDNDNDKNNELTQDFLISEAINRKIEKSVEQNQQIYISKFEEELERTKEEMKNKLENEIISIKKQYENQFFKKPNWFWGFVIYGLLIACGFLIRYVFNKSQENYYKLLDERTKICDIKIVNIENQLNSLKKTTI